MRKEYDLSLGHEGIDGDWIGDTEGLGTIKW